jgi:hypothetical protein
MTESPRASKSYERVNYEFRPAKQVERRMLVHAFQCLMEAGFQIADYQYTGLGSVYFIDFILFHRYLGIHKFLSVEVSDDIRRRVKFNRPYGCVKIEIGDISEWIPRLSQNQKHIVWLDFDHRLMPKVLQAVHIAASQLSIGSLLLVTIDVEPPGSPEDGPDEWNPRTWMAYFKDEAKDYLWPQPAVSEFGREHLPKVNARLIEAAIGKGLMGRIGVSFLPLFNFLYADGHRMLSVGGMIGTESERRKLKTLDRQALCFLRDSITDDPFEITVPCVTRKERLYLDGNMPCKDDWTPKEFELSADNVKAYRRVYKYFPAYTEMLL